MTELAGATSKTHYKNEQRVQNKTARTLRRPFGGAGKSPGSVSITATVTAWEDGEGERFGRGSPGR
jgi:hypothetical protein